MALVLERIDITDYIRNCVRHMYKHNAAGKMTIRTRSEAEYFKALFNDPRNTTFKSAPDLRDHTPYWNKQLVDYVPSNMGKGFYFYFICNDCERRVKYLYFYSYLYSPLCRKCLRLPYRQPTRPERRVARYLRWHPDKAGEVIEAFIAPKLDAENDTQWPAPP